MQINKQDLIKIAREHVELPDDEDQIEYDSYDGNCSLTFYMDDFCHMRDNTVHYLTTVTFDGTTLYIEGMELESSKDSWWKKIEL